MYDSQHIFDMLVPKSRIVPLPEFLAKAKDIIVIKLKVVTEEIKAKL